jgi:ABC-type Zn uptake system ZnuABC Zn-binding protein ZnuA
LVVEVGGGFQPAFEEAARQASRVVETSETVPGPDPFVWLDPTSMESAVDSIAAAMAAADPPAAQLFKSDAGAYNQLVGSDGIDYQSTLATCPKTTIVTADGAFSVMAKDYYLHDIIVGDRPAAAIVSQLDQAGVSTVFAETWTDNSLIGQVASEAHAKVVTLDTLTGSPPGGWPKSSYIELLEANLGLLSSALNCDDLGVGN